MARAASPKIAVLLPCFNEEAAIGATVAGFRAALPGATVYVYDNNSRDRTREVAAEAGAVVRTEHQQGKGHVVRRMFADIDADVYMMADGDLTYDPRAAPAMVDMLLAEQLDMVVGTRRHEAKEAYRGGHLIGNKLVHRPPLGSLRPQLQRYFLRLPRLLAPLRQEFSGSFVGFEIETEISVHALELRMPVGEMETTTRRGPRLGVEAFDLSRRLADPEDDRHALSCRAPGPVLWQRLARCC